MVTWDEAPTVETSWTDAICDLQGLEFSTGTTAPVGPFAAGELNLQLDNRSGQWSQYDPAGRRVDLLVGRDIAVWAEIDGEPWWLFYGEVAVWRETAEATVEVEAFDAFSRLNQHVGEWDPGADGQTVAARMASILAFAGYTGPSRIETGDVTLYGPLTERTILEELLHTADSDGGVLGVDADGTLVYRARNWGGGRPDATGPPPVLSDNVCTAEAIVWDPVLTSDDETIVNLVVLANVATPAPVVVDAENVTSQTLFGKLTLPTDRTEDLWQTAVQGQALADFIAAQRGGGALRLESATLHLHDPNQDLWLLGIDRRLGDVVEMVHAQPAAGGIQILDLFLVVQGLRHTITPTTWIVDLSTTRAIGGRVAARWDVTTFKWDQIDPLNNVWGH